MRWVMQTLVHTLLQGILGCDQALQHYRKAVAVIILSYLESTWTATKPKMGAAVIIQCALLSPFPGQAKILHPWWLLNQQHRIKESWGSGSSGGEFHTSLTSCAHPSPLPLPPLPSPLPISWNTSSFTLPHTPLTSLDP